MGTETKIGQKLDKAIATIVRRSGSKGMSSFRTPANYADFLSNRMAIVFVIREGVPYSLFSLIQHTTPFSENDWAVFLDLSTKSLQRYKQTLRAFRPIQSEKIIEMAEVTHMGTETFETMEKFKLWLETPVFSLGGLKPLELLKDSYGKEMVIAELTRINHGLLA